MGPCWPPRIHRLQLLWNSAATASHEANPAAFILYDVTDKKANLRAGRNVLAIQGLNDSVSSSDMIIVPELYGGKVVPPTTLEPKINFGTIEVSPASGNQDEEFIQLLNPNSIAVDISDWRLTGGVEHTFLGGTVLPPNGAIYVCPNAAAFRARTVSPKGGEGLLVQGGYKGHLSNFGETLALIDASGATNNTTTYQAQPSDAQRYLVVSEIMYHPSGDGLAEFIELLNISGSVTLDLRGVRFTQGVEFDFTGSAITSLPPGGRVLVVRDLAAFSAAYGTNRPVAGVFTNGSALSNSGELIKLEDAGNGTIREFAYDDVAPWPAGTDAGYSLVLIAPETNPDHALATNWRASFRLGGSPGWPDVARFPADPAGDANGNGERDLIDYVLGNDLGLPPISPKIALQPDPLGGPVTLRLSYPISLSAANAEVGVFFSTDLTTWQDGAAHLELVSREPLGDGRELVTWRVKPPLRDEPRSLCGCGLLHTDHKTSDFDNLHFGAYSAPHAQAHCPNSVLAAAAFGLAGCKPNPAGSSNQPRRAGQSLRSVPQPDECRKESSGPGRCHQCPGALSRSCGHRAERCRCALEPGQFLLVGRSGGGGDSRGGGGSETRAEFSGCLFCQRIGIPSPVEAGGSRESLGKRAEDRSGRNGDILSAWAGQDGAETMG